MNSLVRPLRVVTYNIHKCQGFDRRILPERIVAVVQELNADVVCLQEVVNAPEGPPRYDQAGQIARALSGYAGCFGANRQMRGGTYGNMTLSRLPVFAWKNIDISQKRESRGVLQTDVVLEDGSLVHVFNVHLGTGFLERRSQAARLIGEHVLGQSGLRGPRLVLGDFNEWTKGLATRLLRHSFQTAQPKHALQFPKTFPGMLPFMTLDHCYYEPPLTLVETRLWRSRKALLASDHLPLLTDLRALPAPTDANKP